MKSVILDSPNYVDTIKIVYDGQTTVIYDGDGRATTTAGGDRFDDYVSTFKGRGYDNCGCPPEFHPAALNQAGENGNGQ